MRVNRKDVCPGKFELRFASNLKGTFYCNENKARGEDLRDSPTATFGLSFENDNSQETEGQINDRND